MSLADQIFQQALEDSRSMHAKAVEQTDGMAKRHTLLIGENIAIDDRILNDARRIIDGPESGGGSGDREQGDPGAEGAGGSGG